MCITFKHTEFNLTLIAQSLSVTRCLDNISQSALVLRLFNNLISSAILVPLVLTPFSDYECVPPQTPLEFLSYEPLFLPLLSGTLKIFNKSSEEKGERAEQYMWKEMVKQT